MPLPIPWPKVEVPKAGNTELGAEGPAVLRSVGALLGTPLAGVLDER